MKSAKSVYRKHRCTCGEWISNNAFARASHERGAAHCNRVHLLKMAYDAQYRREWNAARAREGVE